MDDHLREFQARVIDVAHLAEDVYHVDLSGLILDCSVRGRTAATAGMIDNRPFVNCNLEAVNHYCDGMCRDIAPHEVAHLVCFLRDDNCRHNRRWRNICLRLGGNGQREHDFDLSPARKVYTYLYQTHIGRVLEMGQTRHSHLQTGRVLWYSSACHGKVFKWGFLKRIAHHPFRVAS